MGNSAFSISSGFLSSERGSKISKNRQKVFIETLGNYYPFSDDELERLLYFHEQILLHHNPSGRESFSFLQCLGVAAASYIPGVDSNTLKSKVEFLEMNVLPSNFGNSLKFAAFVKEENSLPTSSNSPASPLGISDEFHLDSIVSSYETNPHKKEQLHCFLQGMAEACGRRGGRYALEILFKCCSVDRKEDVADSVQLIDLTYRVALASVYVSNKNYLTLNKGENWGRPEAMIESLRNASKKSMGNRTFGGTDSYYDNAYSGLDKSSNINEEEPASKKGTISKQVFFEWAEDTAPLLPSVLPTFFHALLFADKAFPPSRTPFLFPYFFDNNKSFLLGGSNRSQVYPSLFSFACMSNSLGGMVSSNLSSNLKMTVLSFDEFLIFL